MIRRKFALVSVFLIVTLLISSILPPTAYANSAEPPGLTIIVSFPPDDLSLSIRFADGSVTNAVRLDKETKLWEAHYRFFYGMVSWNSSDRPVFEGATLIAESNEKSFESILPESAYSYHNNLLTLNFNSQRLIDGQSSARQFLLISLRVILTLLIEGLIFLAFGYRKKSSWIAFAAINIITQGILNASLTGPIVGYWFFWFAIYEIIVFITEMIAFPLIIKEHEKLRAVAYALSANFASLILGGFMISFLPI